MDPRLHGVLESLVGAKDKLAKALELKAHIEDMNEFERRWLAARPDCAQLSLAWNYCNRFSPFREVQR
jgi:hypothetical protein